MKVYVFTFVVALLGGLVFAALKRAHIEAALMHTSFQAMSWLIAIAGVSIIGLLWHGRRAALRGDLKAENAAVVAALAASFAQVVGVLGVMMFSLLMNLTMTHYVYLAGSAISWVAAALAWESYRRQWIIQRQAGFQHIDDWKGIEK